MTDYNTQSPATSATEPDSSPAISLLVRHHFGTFSRQLWVPQLIVSRKAQTLSEYAASLARHSDEVRKYMAWVADSAFDRVPVIFDFGVLGTSEQAASLWAGHATIGGWEPTRETLSNCRIEPEAFGWQMVLDFVQGWLLRAALRSVEELVEFLLELARVLEKLLDAIEAFQKYAAFLSSCSGASQVALLYSSAFGGSLAVAHKNVKQSMLRDMYLVGGAREPGTGNDVRSFPGVPSLPPTFSPEVLYCGTSQAHPGGAALAA